MKLMSLIFLILMNSWGVLATECQEKASLVLILKSKDFLENKGRAYLNEKYSEAGDQDSLRSSLNPYSVSKFCESGNPDNDILLNFEYFKRSSFEECTDDKISDIIGSDEVDVHQRPINMVIDFLKESDCSISIQRKSEDIYLELIDKVHGKLSKKKTNFSKLCHSVRLGLRDIYKLNKNCR